MESGKKGQYLKYALGEIVLVVIGILIALQINNWNEHRKDRLKENVLLKEIHSDFSLNLSKFLPVKQNQMNTYNNGAIVLRNLDKMDKPVNRDSVYKHALGMFGGWFYYPSNGVVESLISSGEINLITNDTLRKYLVSWKDVFDKYNEYTTIDREFWSNEIQPYVIEKGSFVNMNSPKNLELLQDAVFLNMLQRKQFFQNNIINAIDGEDGLEVYLKEIARLSDPGTDD